jgi:hypothetical protein
MLHDASWNNDKYSDEYKKAFTNFENMDKYFENVVKIMNECEVFIKWILKCLLLLPLNDKEIPLNDKEIMLLLLFTTVDKWEQMF